MPAQGGYRRRLVSEPGSLRRSPGPVSVSGDQAYEVEVEIEADETATAGLLLFYSERLFAGLGFSTEKMIEFWKGDITTFDKPTAGRLG